MIVLPGLAATSRVEINGEGERGDPLPENRDGLYRVLVAGGSAAECGLLDQRAAWPAVLQDEFSSTFGRRPVHVGDIGRSRMTCGAVVTMLERTLPRYEKLDLLILIVGMSGVVDWLEKGVPAVLPECGLSLDEILPPIRERNFPGRPEVWRPHA